MAVKRKRFGLNPDETFKLREYSRSEIAKSLNTAIIHTGVKDVQRFLPDDPRLTTGFCERFIARQWDGRGGTFLQDMSKSMRVAEEFVRSFPRRMRKRPGSGWSKAEAARRLNRAIRAAGATDVDRFSLDDKRLTEAVCKRLYVLEWEESDIHTSKVAVQYAADRLLCSMGEDMRRKERTAIMKDRYRRDGLPVRKAVGGIPFRKPKAR